MKKILKNGTFSRILILYHELYPIESAKRKSLIAENRCLTTLSNMLGKAVVWKWLERSPFKDGESLLYSKEGGEHFRFITERQLQNVLKQAKTSRSIKDLTLFMCQTGARPGEALSLTWQDVKVSGIGSHVRIIAT